MADKKYNFSDFDTPIKPKPEVKKDYNFSDFPEKVEKGQPGQLATAVGGLYQGATAGFGDELEGIMSALLRTTGLTNAGGPIKNIGYESPTMDLDKIKEAYSQSRDSARDRFAEQEAANPITAMLGNLAGGFLLPAMGAAKGVQLAGKAPAFLKAAAGGAMAGGLGAGLATVGESNSIENMQLGDVLFNTAVGGTLGGVTGGALSGAGKLGSMVSDSDFGDDVAKVFKKVRGGTNLQGKEALAGFNDQLGDLSKKTTEEMVDTFNRYQASYAAKVDQLKVDKPEAVKKQIQDFADNLVEQYVKGGNADVRILDAQILALRKSRVVNENEINELINASKAVNFKQSSMDSANKLSKLSGSKDTASKLKESNDFIDELNREKVLVRRELKGAKKSGDEGMVQELEQNVELLEDQIFDARIAQKQMRFENKVEGIDTTAQQKSTKDILMGDTKDPSNLKALQDANVDIDRQITDHVSTINRDGNTALSGLLEEINKLKKTTDTSNFGTFKSVNKSSIDKFATDMNRPDISGDIQDIIRNNTPGAAELDAGYASAKAIPDLLGLSVEESAKGIARNPKITDNLTAKLKLAAADPTQLAGNQINTIKKVANSPKLNNLLDRGLGVAENYDLNRKMSASGLKSVGGYALRGAHVAGEMAAPIDKVIKAIDKFPVGSVLRQKLVDITKLEPNAQNRAIFILSQQPWFRKATEDENNK